MARPGQCSFSKLQTARARVSYFAFTWIHPNKGVRLDDKIKINRSTTSSKVGRLATRRHERCRCDNINISIAITPRGKRHSNERIRVAQMIENNNRRKRKLMDVVMNETRKENGFFSPPKRVKKEKKNL